MLSRNGVGDPEGERRRLKETTCKRKSGGCREERQENDRNKGKRATTSNGEAGRPINFGHFIGALLCFNLFKFIGSSRM